MKAFLSGESGDRPVGPFLTTTGDVAVVEARRILAVTEPSIQRDGTGVCMIRGGVRSSTLLGRQGQDALAAALAAFVESGR